MPKRPFFPRAAGDDGLDDLRAACKGDGQSFRARRHRNRKAA